MAQLVKNLPTMWENWVQSLGWEDPLEKGKATRPGEFHGLYSPWGLKELDRTERPAPLGTEYKSLVVMWGRVGACPGLDRYPADHGRCV